MEEPENYPMHRNSKTYLTNKTYIYTYQDTSVICA